MVHRALIFLTAACAVGASDSGVGALQLPHLDGRPGARLAWTDAGAAAATGDAADLARAHLKANAGALGIAAPLADLVEVGVRESLVGKHVRYQQQLAGIPIVGAEVIVTVAHDGRVLRVFNNSYPAATEQAADKARVAHEDALDKAWNHLRVHGDVFSLPSSELAYLPQNGAFRLVYRTEITTPAPRGAWRHTIDASSGEILQVEDLRTSKIPRRVQGLGELSERFAAYAGPVRDRSAAVAAYQASRVTAALPPVTATATGSAKVFDPDPRTALMNDALQDSSSSGSFTAAYVTRPLLDITFSSGTHSLVGPYVQIVDWDSPTDAPSTSVSGNWTATRGDTAFNDAMTYYHIDQSQRYLQSLGFSGAKGIQSGSIEVDANGEDGDDNSAYYYGGGVNRMSFGHGGVDDNEDADVILHEYWHAMQHDINDSWSGTDTGAMGEGFGDYWAASYSHGTSNGAAYNPTWAFTWDGHNSYWGGRDLDALDTRYDPAKQYPAHTVVNGDNGDELWGTPVFQAFLELVGRGVPREDVDTIVVESQFGLGADLTMREMAQTMVQTARTLYPQGPHAGVFADKFAHHNILDSTWHVSAPTLSSEPVATPGTSNLLSWTGGTLPAAKRSTGGATPEAASVTATAARRPAGTRQSLSAAAKKTAAPRLSGVVRASGTPVVTAGWVPIKSDGFESGWPGDWQTSGNYTSGGDPVTWGRTTYLANGGNNAIGSQCSVISPATSWPVTPSSSPDLECWVWYGPFDLSDATDARVVFSTWHDLGDGDSFSWLASTDDVDYYGSTLTGGSSNWKQRTFDLTSVPTLGNLCGQSTVYVAFRAIWDTSQDYVDGPFVDDVLIEKYTDADLADLEVQSMTVPTGLQEFHFATIDIQVRNAGAAAAGPSYAELGLSPLDDLNTEDDIIVAEVTVPALAASASTTVQASFRMPVLAAGSGSAWALAKVDSRGSIPESDEDDNLQKHATGVPVTAVTVLYNCIRDDDPAFGSPTNSGWVASQQFRFDGLLPGTQYWYRVKAGAGPLTNIVESEWSNAETSTQDLPMGTPVWWMEQQGLTNGSLVQLELTDGDLDGMRAWEEWRAFTDPNAQTSVLAFTESLLESGDRKILWRSVVGPTYRVLRASQPGGPYSPVETGIAPTPPVNVWTDTSGGAAATFYRVAVE